MLRTKRSLLASVLVLSVIAAACGGSHGSAATDATTAPATTAAGGGTGSTETTAPAGEKFGDMASPCGKGDAKGATANGVTDTEITIGYGDDAGYAAAPGLDKEMSDAMKPFIAWCNDQGGINGRKIVGKYYDGQVTQVTQAMTQACNDKVFMLVGQGWVLDSGQETTRIGCQLASIPAFSVAAAFAHGPGVVQPIPNPSDQVAVSAAAQLAKLFPDAVKKAAFVYADFSATKEPRDRYALAFPKVGWQFQDCDQIYNIAGESDWKPFASNMKACGIEVVVYVGSPNPNFENLLTASKQVGFAPKAWLSDTNQYDSGFSKWNGENGGAGDNLYVRMSVVPFEFAKTVPAVQQYIDLVDEDNGVKAVLGEQAASAFLLWAKSVQSCGSDVTQKCVLDAAAAEKDWTAGGLHSPTNPGANEAAQCGMLLKMDGATWEKVAPTGDELFDCSPSYLIKDVKTDAVTAAKLDANRVATEFGTFTPK